MCPFVLYHGIKYEVLVKYHIRLIDVQGRMVGQWEEVLASGNNSLTRSFSNLAKGTYVLMIPSLGQKVRLVK